MTTADSKHVLSTFRELCQIWNDLVSANAEEECLALIELTEKIRLKWLEAHNENQGLRAFVQSLEQEAEAKGQQLKEAKAQLIDARAQIASLLSKTQSVEAERADYERMFEFVRDLLKDDLGFIPEANQKKYAFLQEKKPSKNKMSRGDSMSTMDDDVDIDYDHTGDSIDGQEDISTLRNGRTWTRRSVTGRGKKRRSRSVPSAPIQEEDEQPRKRSKEDTEMGYNGATVVTTTVTLPVPGSGDGPSTNVAVTRRSLNKSFSESNLNGPPPAYDTKLTPKPILKSQMDLRTPGSTTSLRSWTSSGALQNRRHLFISKTTLKMEYCDFCKKRVPFGKSVLKCQDCHYATHTECRDQVPLPCVPRNPSTPKSAKGGKLADYTPALPPMVPPLVIHCVLEIERRGLETLGIYRIPGAEKDYQDLLHQFLNTRGTPNLKLVDDIHVLASCVKKFLAQLKDPLIPATSWQEFVRAAEALKVSNGASWNQLNEAIWDLPMPNRDTLAFVIMHWKKVVELSEYNKMPLENLAKILGPTVVGYSKEFGGMQMQDALEDTPKQESVMAALLSLPVDYWNQFLTFGDAQPLLQGNNNQELTPEQSPQGTMLGPISGKPGSQARNFSSLKKGKQQHYFAPPWK